MDKAMKIMGASFGVALILAITGTALFETAYEMVFSSSTNQVLGAHKSKNPNECNRIQEGEVYTSAGDLINPGFDKWGYNYGAKLFNGMYCDAYRDADWCQPYRDVDLSMKWNQAWLSDRDCDGDGQLDRHAGHDSYIGSGAWLTNHMTNEYVDDDGTHQIWTYFVKIVAAPSDAYPEDGVWYGADGNEIGPMIWGQFAIVQEMYNDTSTGEHGVQYLSPTGPGFGKFQPTPRELN